MSIWATKWAYEQNVTPCGAKFVLVALADFADAEGHCYPSQKRLAKMTGQSERSVRDHVLALEESGFLRREKRMKADGTRATDEFFLNGPKGSFDPAAKSAGGETLHRQLSPKPPATLSTQPPADFAAYPSVLEPSEEPSSFPPKPPASESDHSTSSKDKEIERLGEWYNLYPKHRRCTKAECIRLYRAAKTKPEIAAMLFKLGEQVASHQWTENSGQYAPGMAKYLQTEGWNAPIAAPPAPKYKSQADWNKPFTGRPVV